MVVANLLLILLINIPALRLTKTFIETTLFLRTLMSFVIGFSLWTILLTNFH